MTARMSLAHWKEVFSSYPDRWAKISTVPFYGPWASQGFTEGLCDGGFTQASFDGLCDGLAATYGVDPSDIGTDYKALWDPDLS